MFAKFKLLVLEAKIHLYGIAYEHYNCMTMRHQYYVDKMVEYSDKLVKTEAEHTKHTTTKNKT